MNQILKKRLNFLTGIKNNLIQSIPFQIGAIVSLLVLRVFFIINVSEIVISKSDMLLDIALGFGLDILLVFGLFLSVSIIAFGLQFLKINLLKTFSWITFFLLFSLTLISNEYFLETNLKLNHLVMKFSLNELIDLMNVQNTFSFQILFQILFALVLFGFTFRISKLKIGSKSSWQKGIIVLNILGFIYLLFVFNYKQKTDQTELKTNTGLYFVKSCIQDQFPESERNKIIQRSEFDDLDPQYLSQSELGKEYPLNHPWEEKSNLADFFRKTSTNTPPNIVVIIVESLSSQFVGKYADQTGNVMPFLDSLSSKSIYFPNTFSSSQRTHNVLPAILASIPHNREHTTFQEITYPEHESMISILKEHYFSRFYCGVEAEFDDMGRFIEYQGTDYVCNNWSPKITKNKANWGNGWGVPDGEMFHQSWIDLEEKNQAKKKAMLDVFLTISTHEPYAVPNQKSHEDFVQKRFSKIRNNTQKTFVDQNRKALSAFNYTDQSIRNFIKKWSKRKEFENTIFIITGDHGSTRCYFDPIKQYEVPLLIYSPLLKKRKTIQNIVSHYDITPSILNYLRTEYELPMRNTHSFLGQELNVKNGFDVNRALVFKNEFLEIDDHFNKGIFHKGGKLYTISQDLKLKEFNSAKKLRFFEKQVKAYRSFAYYCVEQNNLLPEIARKKKTVKKSNHFELKWKFKKNEVNDEFISLINQKKLVEQSTSLSLKIEFNCKISTFKEFQKNTVMICKIGKFYIQPEVLKYSNMKYLTVNNLPLKKGVNRIQFNFYIPKYVMEKVKNNDELLVFIHNLEKDKLPLLDCKISTY